MIRVAIRRVQRLLEACVRSAAPIFIGVSTETSRGARRQRVLCSSRRPSGTSLMNAHTFADASMPGATYDRNPTALRLMSWLKAIWREPASLRHSLSSSAGLLEIRLSTASRSVREHRTRGPAGRNIALCSVSGPKVRHCSASATSVRTEMRERQPQGDTLSRGLQSRLKTWKPSSIVLIKSSIAPADYSLPQATRGR